MMKISGLSAPVEWHCLFSEGDRRYAFLFQSDCVNLCWGLQCYLSLTLGELQTSKRKTPPAFALRGIADPALRGRASHAEHLKMFSWLYLAAVLKGWFTLNWEVCHCLHMLMPFQICVLFFFFFFCKKRNSEESKHLSSFINYKNRYKIIINKTYFQ